MARRPWRGQPFSRATFLGERLRSPAGRRSPSSGRGDAAGEARDKTPGEKGTTRGGLSCSWWLFAFSSSSATTSVSREGTQSGWFQQIPELGKTSSARSGVRGSPGDPPATALRARLGPCSPPPRGCGKARGRASHGEHLPSSPSSLLGPEPSPLLENLALSPNHLGDPLGKPENQGGGSGAGVVGLLWRWAEPVTSGRCGFPTARVLRRDRAQPPAHPSLTPPCLERRKHFWIMFLQESEALGE